MRGGEGCGGGTNDVGFCTLRPDLVVVGAYVSLSEEAPSSSSSSSARFRLPPRPLRLPLVLTLVVPRPRLPLGLPGGRPRGADEGVASVMVVGVSSPIIGKLTRLLPRLPRAETETPRDGVDIVAGRGLAIGGCEFGSVWDSTGGSSGVSFFGCATSIESSSMESSWPCVLLFSGIFAGGGTSGAAANGICWDEVAGGAAVLSCADVAVAASAVSCPSITR
jgi:hypothetical protein